MKNLESFLNKIGLQKKAIDKLMSEEEINVDEIADSYKSQIKTAVSSDPELIDNIKSQINGEVLSKVEHKLKKTFSLDATEMQGKKFDEIVTLAYEKMKASIPANQDEWQTKYMDLAKEHKKIIEDVLPAKEAETKNFIKSYKLSAVQQSKLASKKLIVGTNVALPAIEAKMKELKWNLDINDDGEIQVKTSDGLNVLSKDGTKVLGYDDALDFVIGPDGLNLIQQSNGKPGQFEGTKKNIFENLQDKPKFNLPGLEKAMENAEAMKNMRTFGQ